MTVEIKPWLYFNYHGNYGDLVNQPCTQLDLLRDIPQKMFLSLNKKKKIPEKLHKKYFFFFNIIPICQKNKPVIGRKKDVHFVNLASCSNITVDNKLHVGHAIVSLITDRIRRVCFVQETNEIFFEFLHCPGRSLELLP